jgi:hypothetical protein
MDWVGEPPRQLVRSYLEKGFSMRLIRLLRLLIGFALWSLTLPVLLTRSEDNVAFVWDLDDIYETLRRNGLSW